MLLHPNKNMTTKKRGFSKAEREEIISNAYRLARSGTLSNYLKKNEHIIPKEDMKYLERINKINKTALKLKEFRRIIERGYFSRFEEGYARKIIEDNFYNSMTERVDPNYILNELKTISDNYHDSKIKEFNARKKEAIINLDEIFREARAKKSA